MNRIQDILLFKQVADSKNFSSAAEKLEISISQVSKRLAKLEKELGVVLIQRTTRNSKLTAAGELLYSRAQYISDEVSDAWNAVIDMKDELYGQIKVAAHVSIGLKLVTSFIDIFTKRYPLIDIDLYLDDSDIEFISTGCDLAVRGYIFYGHQGLNDSGFNAKKISSLPLRYCASQEYIKKYGCPTLPDQLIDHRCLSVYRSSFAKNQSKQEWPFLIDDKIHLFKVNSVFSTNNIDALQLLVEKGVGIGPIPYYSSQQLLNDSKIVELLKEYACIRADTFIFYKSGKHIPTRIRLFIDELSHYVSGLLHKF